MFELEIEQPWDTREYASLEAKELREQVIDGPRIYLVDNDHILKDLDI